MEAKAFFIGDTHFGHKTLIHNKYRPFNTIEEHDQLIINNWNSVVSENDIVYVLGDVFFCDKNRSKEIMEQLKGRKRLILGNHDTHKIKRYEYYGFEEVETWDMYKLCILSHEPMPRELRARRDLRLNIHAHVHDLTKSHRDESMKVIKNNPLDYFCVSVEMIDYTPISYEQILYYGAWVNQYKLKKELFGGEENVKKN